jgi:hypothetical protein
MLASGMSEDEILHNVPYLEKADFPTVYACASTDGRRPIALSVDYLLRHGCCHPPSSVKYTQRSNGYGSTNTSKTD